MDRSLYISGTPTQEDMNVKRTAIKRNSTLQSQCYRLDNSDSFSDRDISISHKPLRQATSMSSLTKRCPSNQRISSDIQKGKKAKSAVSISKKPQWNIAGNNHLSQQVQPKITEQNIPFAHKHFPVGLQVSCSFPGTANQKHRKKLNNDKNSICLEDNSAPEMVREHHRPNMNSANSNDARPKNTNPNEPERFKKSHLTYETTDNSGVRRAMGPQSPKQTAAKTEFVSGEPPKSKKGKIDTGNEPLIINKFASCAALWPSQIVNLSSKTGWLPRKYTNNAKTNANKEVNYNKEKTRCEIGDSKTSTPRMAYSVSKEEVKPIARRSPQHSINDLAWLSRKYSAPNRTSTFSGFSGIHASHQTALNLSPIREGVENDTNDFHFQERPRTGMAVGGTVTKKIKQANLMQECTAIKANKHLVPEQSHDKCIPGHVSKIAAYMDEQYLEQNLGTEKFNIKGDSPKKVSQLKENQGSTNRADFQNKKLPTCQINTETMENSERTSFSKSDSVHGSSNSHKANKCETGDRGSEKHTSESSHRGFKCDSFLKEILKEVAEKISRPSFHAKLGDDSIHTKQLTNTPTLCENQTGKSKRQRGVKFPISSAKQGSNEGLNQGSKSLGPHSNEINSQMSEPSSMVVNSYEYEKVQYERNSSAVADLDRPTNKESSPEHSTVSLEVKSVNLSFSCADKHIQNSSRQIRIKWCISPNTNTKWRTESIVVEDASNLPDNKVDDACKEPDKDSVQVNKKRCRPKSSRKYPEYDKNGRIVPHNEPLNKSESVETAVLTNASSPQQPFCERLKHVLTRPCNTTLRSPSPCQTSKCPCAQPMTKWKNNTIEGAKEQMQNKMDSHCFLQTELLYSSAEREAFGLASPGFKQCAKDLLLRKSMLSTSIKTPNGSNVLENIARYKHKCATKILAKNPENNLVPRTEDRYLILQLDWGMYLIVVTAIPLLLFLLSMNFYIRASMVTENEPSDPSEQ